MTWLKALLAGIATAAGSLATAAITGHIPVVGYLTATAATAAAVSAVFFAPNSTPK